MDPEIYEPGLKVLAACTATTRKGGRPRVLLANHMDDAPLIHPVNAAA